MDDIRPDDPRLQPSSFLHPGIEQVCIGGRCFRVNQMRPANLGPQSEWSDGLKAALAEMQKDPPGTLR